MKKGNDKIVRLLIVATGCIVALLGGYDKAALLVLFAIYFEIAALQDNARGG